MDRTTFSAQIAALRKASHISMRELCVLMNALPTAIYRIEKGTYSFRMDKAIALIVGNGYSLKLNFEQTETCITTYNDLITWMKESRAKHYSQRAFSKLLGTSQTQIAFWETQKVVMSVDNFLSIADAMSCEIQFQKIITCGN